VYDSDKLRDGVENSIHNGLRWCAAWPHCYLLIGGVPAVLVFQTNVGTRLSKFEHYSPLTSPLIGA